MHEIVVGCKGVPLRHSLQRMLAFCALDAYRAYDRRGAELNAQCGDEVTPEHVVCINTMHTRSPVTAWEPFAQWTGIVRHVPSDRHLLEMPDEDWPEAREAVAGALREMTSRKRIGLAAATKMLALKRPDLVPACDSQLLAWFGVDTYYYADQAGEIMDRLREIGRAADNLATLIALQAELGARELDGKAIRLSATRILEVLCWMATTDRYGELLGLLGWD